MGFCMQHKVQQHLSWEKELGVISRVEEKKLLARPTILIENKCSCSTQALAEKLNRTPCRNNFLFWDFFILFATAIILSRLCYVCCRLCCTAQCRTQNNLQGCFHFLLQCDMPISGFVGWNGFGPSWATLYTLHIFSWSYSAVQLITILARIFVN